MKNLLVLGARENSIGQRVAQRAQAEWNVTTLGIHDEDIMLELGNPMHPDTLGAIEDVINEHPWHAVVCTLGYNVKVVLGKGDGDEDADRDFNLYELDDSLAVNTLAPLVFLDRWLRFWLNHDDGEENLHFVAISSNSAHVPRSTGVGYCASKAALSMALRCAARDVAHRNPRISVYGYEPGWVAGTPMSQQVQERLGSGVLVSRAPGNRALTAEELARMIYANLSFGNAINGSMIRVDAGEV